MKRLEAGRNRGAGRILLAAVAAGRVIALASVVLLLTACPPVTYHDGVMAYAPEPGEMEGILGANLMFTNFHSPWDQGWYALVGAHAGQRAKWFVFEEGLNIMPRCLG